MINQINTTVYDGYNIELASTKIKLLLLENTANLCSSFNNVKYDLDDKDDQYLLYTQFVVWYCNGPSMVPLSDYADNEHFKNCLN